MTEILYIPSGKFISYSYDDAHFKIDLCEETFKEMLDILLTSTNLNPGWLEYFEIKSLPILREELEIIEDD